MSASVNIIDRKWASFILKLYSFFCWLALHRLCVLFSLLVRALCSYRLSESIVIYSQGDIISPLLKIMNPYVSLRVILVWITFVINATDILLTMKKMETNFTYCTCELLLCILSSFLFMGSNSFMILFVSY
jgi:hypothetical protein